MRIIVIGDVVGDAGKRAVEALLGSVKQQYKPQLTIVNAENIANGRGITQTDYKWLLNQGVDVVTLGNHAFDNRNIHSFINEAKVLVRPWNMSEDTPGKGVHYIKINQDEIAVINLLGISFMKNEIDPFAFLKEKIKEVKQRTNNIIIDFHAESTSEKQAMGYWLDGQVSFVYGTHTHVQTNDARILSNGTGYMTDIGMTGAVESVIGFQVSDVVQRFVENPMQRLKVEDDGKTALRGVFFEIDTHTSKVKNIKPINLEF
ncbi:TIGR00282 family metallophosphoesterase [Aerococcaceae bacterium DSM 111022]|nr:TIGR00282 family metallophosphoesterase [Aerococcaceae bacterium DSM 111022]